MEALFSASTSSQRFPTQLAMANKALWTAALIILCSVVWRFLRGFWWRPRAIAVALQRQGIQGPPHKLMVGNASEVLKMTLSAEDDMKTLNHDILEHILPDFFHWSKRYGKPYVYWWGEVPRVVISDPEMIREVLSKKPGQFEKSLIRNGMAYFFGNSIANVNGDEWAHHRRIVAPAFYLERLKGMVASIVHCTAEMLDNWEARIEENPELEASESLQKLTADIISHTAFGSNYLKGKRVFELLTAILERMLQVNKCEWFSCSRLLPYLEARKMHTELKSILMGIINQRREMLKLGTSISYGNDLLGLVLAESEQNGKAAFDDETLMDECKVFYFAGHETTTTLLTWVMLLLAVYPDWQHRVRMEVLETCQDGVLDADVLSKFKLMGMVLNETLRLYSPISMMLRACIEDTKLGSLHVPKGTTVAIPVLAIHHDPELWGPDASEFNPERFKDGIVNACKHPNAFMPFSFGPRVCVGQTFALMEAKAALAMILRRFSFELSPNYRHNPARRPILKPLHGLPLIFKKLC